MMNKGRNMVWEQAKTALKERLGESIFNLWIAPLE
jgi:hypothetical protein